MRTALDQLRDSRPSAADRINEDAGLLQAFAAVVSASRSMTRLLLSDPATLDVLADLDRRSPAEIDDAADLVRWKQHELLRIAARDLAGHDDLAATGDALAQMGDVVLREASSLAGATQLAIIAMGKLGARELNYASDVDVLFATRNDTGDGDGEARRVLEIARMCFRVDANLRPEGRSGPLTRSLGSYKAYWDDWARPWELQALIKARACAGDVVLGVELVSEASRRVWSATFGPDQLTELRDMKVRAEGQVERRGLAERELKRGRGGIRDIEFAVQLLQLVHGHSDPSLRVLATLPALTALADGGYVAEEDALGLAAAYRFLRTAEHRLQLEEEQQVHSLPANTAARARLARVMGYRDSLQHDALEAFDRDVAQHQAVARRIHERLFFRPLLESFAGRTERLPSEAAEARLAAFGFADAERTRVAVRELTRGFRRSSRLMRQMLPVLLEWLSETPDPDMGLLGLRTLATGEHLSAQLTAVFREAPDAAHRLCTLVGTSRLITDGLARRPGLIADLAGRDPLNEHIRASVAGPAGLRPLVAEERTRLMARDVLGMDSLDQTGASLTLLAERVLEAALGAIGPSVPFAVIAVGRLGGGDLGYASDLDVLLVHKPIGEQGAGVAEPAAERLLELVNGTTPAARIATLDVKLRPEGRHGLLAPSVDAFRAYWDGRAETWERQAMARARFAAGDAELGQEFMDAVDAFVWQPPFGEVQAREIRRMKARVEKERLPPGEDPEFHLKLGKGSLSDVEWTTQLLQLTHRVRSTGTIAALSALRDHGVLTAPDHDRLTAAYRFCERTRNRWFLVKGGAGDALPTRARELGVLARSLSTTAAELRDEYRRVTRRAREVVERLFYGR